MNMTMKQPTPKMVRDRAKDIAAHLETAPINATPCMQNSLLLQSLGTFLDPERQNYVLFGYSDFKNTGDQALWFALSRIIETVARSKGPARLIMHPSELKQASRDGDFVIFPGGGSLGNRYNSSRRRVALLELNPSLRFVQMPVSTSFSDDRSLLSHLRKAYAREGSHIFVRDSRSKAEAAENAGLDTMLSPDLVEFLPECESFASRDFGVLHLLRTDEESTGAGNIAARKGIIKTDWRDFILRTRLALVADKALLRGLSIICRKSDMLNTLPPLSRLRYNIARKFALHDTAIALSYLSFFERIVTDRLHGIILSRNLGLRIEAIDNDHRKLSRYTQAWGQRYEAVTFREMA